MIIMNVKGACVSLRLTFLGGTDSTYRRNVRTYGTYTWFEMLLADIELLPMHFASSLMT